MTNVVYVNEVGFNLHLTCHFGRARRGPQRNCPTQRGQNLSWVVVVGREGVIAHDVTLGAYNTNKLLKLWDTSTYVCPHIVHFLNVVQ